MDSSFRVLIIDENLQDRDCFKKALFRLGCSVVEADTTERGIEEFSNNHFKMVFAVLCARDIGARGLARWVKKHKPDTKFFIITSWKGELEKMILHHDGIHGVVHKPLCFNEIRELLLEHLG